MDKNTQAPVMERDIDLVEIFCTLRSKLWLLIISTIISAFAVGTVAVHMEVPQYTATSIIYILSKTTSITSITDLQLGSTLTADFTVIATTREVVEDVMEQCGIDSTYSAFVSRITVVNPKDTHMLKISVTDPDPQLAANASNALADTLRTRIANVMSTDTPSMVERAVVPWIPNHSNAKNFYVIGAVIGLIFSSAIVLFAHFLDDSIRDESDVRRLLGVEVLAAIPLDRSGMSGKRTKKAKKKEAKEERKNRKKKKKENKAKKNKKEKDNGNAVAPAAAVEDIVIETVDMDEPGTVAIEPMDVNEEDTAIIETTDMNEEDTAITETMDTNEEDTVTTETMDMDEEDTVTTEAMDMDEEDAVAAETADMDEKDTV